MLPIYLPILETYTSIYPLLVHALDANTKKSGVLRSLPLFTQCTGENMEAPDDNCPTCSMNLEYNTLKDNRKRFVM